MSRVRAPCCNFQYGHHLEIGLHQGAEGLCPLCGAIFIQSAELSAYGIQVQLHAWFTDFLYSCSQRVALKKSFHFLSLSRLVFPKAMFWAQCYSSSSSMISLTLWKILFIYLLTTPSTMTSLILQTGRLQPLPFLQTITKSQDGQTLEICLSILTNLVDPCFSPPNPPTPRFFKSHTNHHHPPSA